MNPSFVGIYDNILTDYECKILIDYFESSPKDEGFIFKNGEYVLDPSIKKCRQLDRETFSQNKRSSIIQTRLLSALDKYLKQYPKLKEHINTFKLDDGMSFKRFDNEEDGFKNWHCEHGLGLSSTRILVWQFYLNNAKSGTEFLYYPTVRAKAGRCVIWPASITHYHRSQLPNKGVKYIISGWWSFIAF